MGRFGQVFVSTALAFATLHPSTSRASDDQSGHPDPGVLAQARRLAQEGAADYDRGHYAEALEEFEQASHLYPAPALLSNLSHTELKLGRCKEALDYALKFAAASVEAPAAARAAAAAWQAHLASECAEVTLTSDPPGASVWLDDARGELAGVTPCTLRILAGSHVALMQVQGQAVHRERLDLQAGMSPMVRHVSFQAAATVPPAPVVVATTPAPESFPSAAAPTAAVSVAPPATAAAPPPAIASGTTGVTAANLEAREPEPPMPLRPDKPVSTAPARSGAARPWGIAAVAVGAAALVAGVVLQVYAHGETTALESSPRSGAQVPSLVSTINSSVVGGGVALGAGVAGAVVGTTLLVSF